MNKHGRMGRRMSRCLFQVFALLCALAASSAPAASLYFVHTDHLGTPQKITDGAQQVVWEGSPMPFGETEVVVNQIDFHVRFPGQYFDGEVGLHYNYFRDYDPSLGRYIQSDPIGLEAGPNTYAYVGGNSLTRVDPLGLLDIFIGGGGDSASGIVKNYQAAYARANPSRNSLYFEWDQQGAIVQTIIEELKNNPCEPINLVGHSYGGATAANSAEALSAQGFNTTTVITVDPVSRRWSRSGAGNANTWINVLASNEAAGGGRGNFIALLGGKWRNWPQGKADYHYTAPFNHAQFSRMLNHVSPEGRSALQALLDSQSGCECRP